MARTSYRTLREYFERTGTQQQELAAQVGVSSAYINQILNGVRRPSLAVAVRLAGVARIPISSLLSSRRAA